jgi:hypothetical protein
MGDVGDHQPNPSADDGPVYQPQDALGRSARSAAITGAAGLFIASVQNTVAKEQVGAFGVFTRFGTTIGLLSMIQTKRRAKRGHILTVPSGDGRSLPIFKYSIRQSTGKERFRQ